MYCPNCGAKIEKENAKFCPECGAPVKEQSVKPIEKEQNNMEKPKREEKPKKAEKPKKTKKEQKTEKPRKSKKKWFVILLIILLLGGAAAGAMFIKQKANNDKADSSKQEAISETKENDTNKESEVTLDEITPEETEESDASQSDELIPGSNMSDAVLVPLGTKVFGKIEPETYIWFSFTTGNEEGATYIVTVVDATVESEGIQGILYDEYGNQLKNSIVAEKSGTPESISCDDLQPNTTYYIRLSSYDSKKTMEYSLIVKNPNDKTTAYKTVGSFSQTGGTSNVLEGEIVAGSNQSASTYLDLETQITGTISPAAYIWFSFTTGEEEENEYNIVLVDKTVESEGIQGILYDEYGKQLKNSIVAEKSGTPENISSDDLQPNTTYYIRLASYDSKKTMEYSLVVKSPNAKKNEKANLVFEVPFEINATQVQFVADQATFIDEAKAKEVLKPVAEAILNAPEHAIMIAGTTATDGTQESCVDLSNRRAEAVKNLLVKTYKVPESQIKTVGLGYEKDPFERGADIDGNGNFVESEAVKNRRVVILDADDEIAKQLTSN